MTLTACRSTEVHSLRVGYTLPSMEATLYHADGTVIDLTDVDTVRIIARKQGTNASPKIDRDDVVILSPATAGGIRLNFFPGDVDTVARYDAYFVLTYSDSRELPVPNPGFFSINVGVA
jgi:hypothetical protein